MIEQELADTNESLSDQTCTNQAICGAKMKCEQEMGAMSHDLDEMVAEAGMSEEKAQRAMVDAARLADELRQEQELAMNLERDKKLLEAQVKDAQSRFALFPHCLISWIICVNVVFMFFDTQESLAPTPVSPFCQRL